jgi:Ser/Thr protein kinase RdoA (MazF antagonist)
VSPENGMTVSLHRAALSVLPAIGVTARGAVHVASSHNATFRIEPTDGTAEISLRLYRLGVSPARVASEATVLHHLAEVGFAAPRPVRNREGTFVLTAHDPVDGYTCLALASEWIEGDPLSPARCLSAPDRLGALVAEFHRAMASFAPPAGFDRPVWDADGLRGGVVGADPDVVASLASVEERALLAEAHAGAASVLPSDPGRTGLSLIHTDPRRDNILDDGKDLTLLDFDGCGWGVPAYDLAVLLAGALAEDPVLDAPAYLDAVLTAYRRAGGDDSIGAGDVHVLVVARLAVHLSWYLFSISDPCFPEEPGFRRRQSALLAEGIRRAR